MQQPGGNQFGGPNQSNYYMPTPSPYQHQQGTPMSSFVHSPGSAIEPSPGGGVYQHQQQQQQQQLSYQYMAPSPAQQSDLSRHLGFGSAPASVGSPMAAGSGSNYRTQPASIQPHMMPPTPQPPTPRGGPQTPASVGPIGSVGGGDYGGTSVGGPGSVNPATPRSVGEPLSVSDQQQTQMMTAKSATSASSSFAAALMDQDSNSQMDSPQQQQQQQQSQMPNVSVQHQQPISMPGRTTLNASMSSQNLNESSASAGSRGQSVAGAAGISMAAMALQNLDQYGPLALCSMGKELTQELVNRTADTFLMLRQLTDPSQMIPKTGNPELSQQLFEKEKRLNDNLRQTVALVHRLLAISARLEQLSKERLPDDAQDRLKELLPYIEEIDMNETDRENGDQMDIDKKPTFLDTIRGQAEHREEYQSVRAEHENIKSEHAKKRDHLRKIMEFLRDFCWQVSVVLDSNATS